VRGVPGDRPTLRLRLGHQHGHDAHQPSRTSKSVPPHFGHSGLAFGPTFHRLPHSKQTTPIFTRVGFGTFGTAVAVTGPSVTVTHVAPVQAASACARSFAAAVVMVVISC